MRRIPLPAAIGLLVSIAMTCPAVCAEVLTLDAALARARSRSPAVLAAIRRVEEARARQGNLPLFRDNPEVEAALGRRDGTGPDNLELGVSQTFELGGARGARRALAGAAIARETAGLTNAERAVTRDVASAFLRALHAEERARVAQTSERFAAELKHVAQRRHEAGDVAALDVNAAVSALGRARAELKSAQAERVSAEGDLRVLIDIPPGEVLTLEGRLHEPQRVDAAALLLAAKDRADLKVLHAELAEAEAEARVARAAEWPTLTPAVRYERDDGERIVWAGLSVRLPVFDRGQQVRAVSRVRVDSVRDEMAALTRAIETRVRTAHRRYELRAEAADEMQATLAAMDDNEQLAHRSYEVGQIGLGDLLVVRRETAETRRVWLSSLLEAAQARYDLESEAGVSR